MVSPRFSKYIQCSVGKVMNIDNINYEYILKYVLGCSKCTTFVSKKSVKKGSYKKNVLIMINYLGFAFLP